MQIQTFTYQQSTKIRTVDRDGEPWFVLKDVCEALDITNPSAVAARLDPDERAKFNLGRQGEATIITEAGLYNVILRSDKPAAQDFRRWVTHEVLPTIRKTGSYGHSWLEALTNDVIEDFKNPTTVAQMQREVYRMQLNTELTESAKTLVDAMGHQQRCEAAMAETKRKWQDATALYHEAKACVADAKEFVARLRGHIEEITAQLRQLESGQPGST